MKVTSSEVDYFYIWDELKVLVFSTYRPINQGFVTTIKFQKILNLVSVKKILCIEFV